MLKTDLSLCLCLSLSLSLSLSLFSPLSNSFSPILSPPSLSLSLCLSLSLSLSLSTSPSLSHSLSLILSLSSPHLSCPPPTSLCEGRANWVVFNRVLWNGTCTINTDAWPICSSSHTHTHTHTHIHSDGLISFDWGSCPGVCARQMAVVVVYL